MWKAEIVESIPRTLAVGLACTSVAALGACGAGITPEVIPPTPPSTHYVPEVDVTPGSIGTAILSGVVVGMVRAELQAETGCIPIGNAAGSAARQAIWEYTSQQGSSSSTTHWVTIDWTRADVGRTVSLSPKSSEVGVQFADAGRIEHDWASTSGTLTILASGTRGHVSATLSPDDRTHNPGKGTVFVQADWTC